MIDPLKWPMETNAAMRDELLKDKLNEVVALLNERVVLRQDFVPEIWSPDSAVKIIEDELEKMDTTTGGCSHTDTRTLKNGRKFCEDCRKLVKG